MKEVKILIPEGWFIKVLVYLAIIILVALAYPFYMNWLTVSGAQAEFQASQILSSKWKCEPPK